MIYEIANADAHVQQINIDADRHLAVATLDETA